MSVNKLYDVTIRPRFYSFFLKGGVSAGADPGFLDRGFKLDEGGVICAVWPIFPEIPHENEII